MKKIAIILLSLMMVFALVACGGNTGTDTNTNTDTTSDTNTNTDTSTDTTDTNTSTDTGNGGNVPDVPQTPTYESSSVEETLKEELGVFEEETTFGNEGSLGFTTNNEIDVSKYLNKKISITEGGTYKVYGTSSDGQISIEAVDQDVYIVLAGVSLTSGNSITGPAIFAKDCASVTIILEDGTENYLADNSANDGEGAVIRVRSCPLTLDGTGSLTIEANAKNAIANTKELTIEGGKYNIKAPGHGIYGKLGLTINGGTFDIEAEKSGFKSGDGDDTTNYEYGYIDINAGNTVISCGTNGFNCVGPVTIDNGRVEINAETG
ncbi:MAG: carbohydrate-binding domain-containing protein, partial [Clostridia bacterium]|nr:carbohydrate-binding domain-containing protein [Clostridia bacterium]